MMTSNCQNCGNPKQQGHFADDYCTDCFAAASGAMAAASAEGKDEFAAKRQALAERAHHAHRNFVDPRALDRRTIWIEGNRPSGASDG